MSRLPSYGLIVLTAMLLVVGQLLTMPLSVFASSSVRASEGDSPFNLPDGAVLLFINRAKGVQSYQCRNSQWVFHAPRAKLFDTENHRRTGIHYGGIDHNLTPGPWWESSSDDSRIRGGNPVSAPSPNPDSIPLLQLEVLEWYGTGVFSQVTTIQRLNTVGGVGPTGECTTGQWRRVPYTADYYFYGNP